LVAENFDAVSMVGLIDCQHTAFEMLLRDDDRPLLRDAGSRIVLRGMFIGCTMPASCRGRECTDR